MESERQLRRVPKFGRADGKGAHREAAGLQIEPMVEIETFEDEPDPVETSRPATAVWPYCSLLFWRANVLGVLGFHGSGLEESSSPEP